MTNGDWINNAMCDDSLVAEALICLLHAEPPQLPSEKIGGESDLKFQRSVRRRRSTMALMKKKKGDHDDTCASPTTPLSWSGGCVAVDGFEESSGAVKISEEVVRSKISQTSVTTTTSFKRSRKKKTLAQLKQEESSLLKEKKGLNQELTSMQDQLKHQRARNKSLKKMQTESEKNGDSCFLLPDLNIPLDNNLIEP